MSDATADRQTGDRPQIVATPETLGGDPRIEGTRIGVHTVYERYTRGDADPERIAADYDLSLAAVHAALAYAYANVDEMRAVERRTAELRETNETLTPK